MTQVSTTTGDDVIKLLHSHSHGIDILIVDNKQVMWSFYVLQTNEVDSTSVQVQLQK